MRNKWFGYHVCPKLSCWLVALLAGLTGTGCEPPAGGTESVGMEYFAFGTSIGEVSLVDALGTSSTLVQRIAGSPGLVMILDEASCLSCGDYATELKIIEHKWPKLVQLVVAEGPIDRELDEYFRVNGILPLSDPNRELLRRLGQERPPVIVVVNPEGRVLLSDSRFGMASARFPVSRVLVGLAAALNPDQR